MPNEEINIVIEETVEQISVEVLDNNENITVVIQESAGASNHSQLNLDDGTNPHGTTKSDVGLGNVPNLDTTNAVNNEHTHSNKSVLDLINEAFTAALKISYDSVVSGYDNLINTGARLITNDEITKLSNTSGTNTGDQDLSGLLVKSNNLSDLNNAATARSNLGLGSLATQNGNFADKLDKVISAGTERVYIINPDGTQATKAVSSLSGYTVIGKITTDSIAITGTTAEILVESYTIPGNTYQVGDILVFRRRVIKTGTAGFVNIRTLVRNSSSAIIYGIYTQSSATSLYTQHERTSVIKSATITQDLNIGRNALTSNSQQVDFFNSNIDWTQNVTFEFYIQLGNGGDSALTSYWEISRIR